MNESVLACKLLQSEETKMPESVNKSDKQKEQESINDSINPQDFIKSSNPKFSISSQQICQVENQELQSNYEEQQKEAQVGAKIKDNQSQEEEKKGQVEEEEEVVIEKKSNMEIFEDLQILLAQDQQIEPASKALIFLGQTGCGKTTTACHMQGQQLKAYKKNTGQMLIMKSNHDENDKVKISPSSNSETKVPNKLDVNGIAIYDCAGFDDTCGDEQEVANSFCTNRMFERTDSKQICLVVAKGTIYESRSTGLIDQVNYLIRIFKEDFNLSLLKGSLALIVTKVGIEMEAMHIQNKLIEVLKECKVGQKNINAKTKQVLEYLKDNVHIFRIPENEGLIPQEEGANLLKQVSSSMNFISIESSKVNIAVSEKTNIALFYDLTLENVTKINDCIIQELKDFPKKVGNANNNNREQITIPKIFHQIAKKKKWEEPGFHWFPYMEHANQLNIILKSCCNEQNIGIDKFNRYLLQLIDTFVEFQPNEEIWKACKVALEPLHRQLEFFNEICKKNSLVLGQLMSDITKCNGLIDECLVQQITKLNLDLGKQDINYYEKALQYLDIYEKEECCKQNSAIAHLCISQLYKEREDMTKYCLNIIYAFEFDSDSQDVLSKYEKIGDYLFFVGSPDALICANQCYSVDYKFHKQKKCFKRLLALCQDNNSKLSENYNLKGKFEYQYQQFDKAKDSYMTAYSYATNSDERKEALKNQLTVENYLNKVYTNPYLLGNEQEMESKYNLSTLIKKQEFNKRYLNNNKLTMFLLKPEQQAIH